MQRPRQFVVGAALLSMALATAAQKPVIYPAKGQSASQQAKDDSGCASWARQNTDVDPAMPPSAAQASAPAPPRGGLIKGAAVGATIGAVGGNSVGNAALKGAVVGGVAQRSRKKGQQEAVAAQTQQTQGQQQQAISTYWRAYGACMSGRGYTINGRPVAWLTTWE